MGIALGWMAVACAFAPSAHAGDAFFGLFSSNMSTPSAQLNATLDAQARTGAGVVREHLHWDRIERHPGVFDWAETDALFSAASARGMTVLPVLVDTPQFYSTRPPGYTNGGWPPADPVAIRRFSTELAKRYGTRGTYFGCLLPGFLCRRTYRPVTAWQVWNEPDLLAWWRTGPNAAAYTALLRQAYEGLKAGDASAEVVLGGLVNTAAAPGGYLEQLYDNGAAAYFDTLAIHPYGGNAAGVIAVIQGVRGVADRKGDAGVPIRATEYGFATGGRQGWVVSVPCQAALLASVTRELSARRTELGLRSIIQFQWQDRSSDPTTSWPNHAGMLYVDGTAKPALAAFTDAVAGRPPAAGLPDPSTCVPQPAP